MWRVPQIEYCAIQHVTKEEANELLVAVDTSYAPAHENFESIQGIMMTLGGGKNPLMWS